MAVTLFVAVEEQGAMVPFDGETEQALETEAAFHRDFNGSGRRRWGQLTRTGLRRTLPSISEKNRENLQR